MSYAQNKERAKTHPKLPTLTDQSAAKDTDINIIVQMMRSTGQAMGSPVPPVYEDFSMLPADFREMIHMTRELGQLHAALPAAFKGLTIEEIAALTPERAKAIIAPPQAPTPAAPPEEKK